MVQASDARPGFRPGLAYCLSIFLAARILLSLTGVVAVGHISENPIWRRSAWSVGQRATPGWHNAIDGTYRWDASWFAKVVDRGYRSNDGSAAFFPAYPAATWIVATTGLSALASGELVANVAFLAALVVLYALTILEYSVAVARRTVVLAALSPTAFFFLSPYSESPYLLLAVLAFWFARRDRWVAAGLAGALAALTRGVGIVLLPALIVDALAGRDPLAGGRGRRIASVSLVAFGPLLYSGAWWLAAGTPLRPWTAQVGFNRTVQLPVLTLWRGFT